jgi:hypothetical protein
MQMNDIRLVAKPSAEISLTGQQVPFAEMRLRRRSPFPGQVVSSKQWEPEE